MSAIQWLAIPILLLFIGQWALKHVIKPRKARQELSRWLNKPHIKHGSQIIERLYQGVDAKRISDQGRQQLKANSNSFVYGEIDFLGFAELLEAAHLDSGGVFYDLGSGAGRAVFSAVLLHNFQEAKGVELLPALYQLSCRLLEKFNHMPDVLKFFGTQQSKITFIQNNILTTDLRDATVVFINATAFFGELWAQIESKLTGLSSGTTIILTSQQLKAGCFQLIEERKGLMSWGVVRVFIYKRV